METERWTAVRVLRSADTGRTVTVCIGVPVQVSGTYATCPVVVEGERGRVGADGHGIDPIQALLCGLVVLRRVLSESYPEFYWEVAGEGDTGFPRMVIEGNLDYRRRIDELVDDFARKDLETAKQAATGGE